jgi:hypothetical protein
MFPTGKQSVRNNVLHGILVFAHFEKKLSSEVFIEDEQNEKKHVFVTLCAIFIGIQCHYYYTF